MTTLKRKIGETVTILSPLPLFGHKGYLIDRYQENFAGETTTIIGYNHKGDGYLLDIGDGIRHGFHTWTETMLVQAKLDGLSNNVRKFIAMIEQMIGRLNFDKGDDEITDDGRSMLNSLEEFHSYFTEEDSTYENGEYGSFSIDGDTIKFKKDRFWNMFMSDGEFETSLFINNSASLCGVNIVREEYTKEAKESLSDIARWIKNLSKGEEVSPNTREEMQMIKNLLNSLGLKYESEERWHDHYVKIRLTNK